MGDDVTVKLVVINYQNKQGVIEFIKKSVDGDYVGAQGIKQANCFTPRDAQRFINAAKAFPFQLYTQAVK